MHVERIMQMYVNFKCFSTFLVGIKKQEFILAYQDVKEK
jgi:hypothetical protein